jgi:hypothetical protein
MMLKGVEGSTEMLSQCQVAGTPASSFVGV